MDSLLGPLDRSISSVRGASDFFNFIKLHLKDSIFQINSKDTDQTPLWWRLIWVYTVYNCPFYGSPGIRRLRQIASSLVFRVTYDMNNTENGKQEMLLNSNLTV